MKGSPPKTFPVEPRRVDEELVALFAPQRYDRINHAVSERVCETYRHELYSSCKSLLENDRILGRAVRRSADDDEDNARNQEWDRDPATMSNAELFKARVALEERIEQQRRLNEQYRGELEILELAAKRAEWEVGCQLAQLEHEENQDF